MGFRTLAALGAVTVLAVGAPSARAEQAVGLLEGADMLVTLDTAAPGTFTGSRLITGLTFDEHVRGVDFRHMPSQTPPVPPSRLFALGVAPAGVVDSVRLLTIDPGTGVATPVSAAPFSVTPGTAYGVDFNPTVDRFRVVNDADENFRINPNNGGRADTPTNDTDLNPAGNRITAVAHDRVNIPTPPAIANQTTLYGINITTSQLVTIGGINQSPSPNGGAVLNGKPLGVFLPFASVTSTNLDITLGGTAFATLTPNSTYAPGLYTINLSSGAATLVGNLPAPLGGFTTVPGSSAQFDVATISQPESGAATVTVTRSGSLWATTTVDYATSDGTANSGDYTPVSGTLTFAPDEATKTFSVAVTDDAVDEPDEIVNLTLSAPSGPTTLGSQSTATLTIADDDPAPAAPATPVVAALDTTPPAIVLSGVRASMKLKAFLKGFKATVTPSEPAALSGQLDGSVRTARLSAYELRLASKSLPLAAGRRTLSFKPKRKLVGHPRKKFKVRLRITATDAARNAKVVTKTIVVKPGR